MIYINEGPHNAKSSFIFRNAGLVAPPVVKELRVAPIEDKVRVPVDGGALVRVIAGELDGHAGPGITHTPITYAHTTVSPGASVEVPWEPSHNALIYVLAGRGTVGPSHQPIATGQLAALGPVASAYISLQTGLLSGVAT